ALLSARCKLGIVILHNYFGHHFRRDVVAVSEVFPVNGIGVNVVLWHEHQSSANALRKTGKNINFLRRRTAGKFGIAAGRNTIVHLMRTAIVSSDGGSREYVLSG